MKQILWFVLAICLPVSLPGASKISGVVKTAMDDAPKQAHVLLTALDQYYNAPLRIVATRADGTFELDDVAPGSYRLFFAGVDHEIAGFPIRIVENDPPIQLQVQLQPLQRSEQLDDLKIIGDWNDFNFNSAAAMQRQTDGTFVFEAEASSDTLGYQVLGLHAGGRSVNGTMADYYVYDGGGDYRSVLRVKPGKVKIIFDPKKLPELPAAARFSVTFDAAHKDLEALATVLTQASDTQRKLFEARRAHTDAGKPPEEFSYDASETLSRLHALTGHENEFVRQMAALHFFEAQMWPGVSKFLPAELKIDRLIEMIPAASPVWGALTQIAGFLPRLVFADEQKKEPFLQKFMQENPSKRARANMLATMVHLAKQQNQTARFDSLYKELAANYADSPSARFVISLFDPDRKIKVGNKVPAFEVQLLNDEEKVSDKSLLGKYYLLDFWAVWCGPCVAEMPNLHQSYEKYKGQNLVFLSLSFDRSPEDVAEFREKKFAMPWLHTFVEGGFNSELAKKFEVLGIPKPIFVGPDGTILATEIELRGANLSRTLEKFLEHSANK